MFLCLDLHCSSLISFDLCFRAPNWYSSIVFTHALLSGSTCASVSPILIKTESWVLPDLSFFAQCKTIMSCCLLKVFAIWFAACVSVCLGCFLDINFFFMTLCLSLVSCLIALCSLWYFLLVLAVGCWTCISHAVCFYPVTSGRWVSWLISWCRCRLQQERYLEGFGQVSWFLVCRRFWSHLLCLSRPWFQNILFLLQSYFCHSQPVSKGFSGILSEFILSDFLKVETWISACVAGSFVWYNFVFWHEVCTMSIALDNFFFLVHF